MISVSITPVDVSAITAALKKQLTEFPALADTTVIRSDDRELDPSACPWIGIYRMGVQYQARVLGFGGGMRDQRVRLLLLATEADPNSGEACEEALEALIQKIVAAILSDPTIGGTVSGVDEFEVNYATYDKTQNYYMQTADIQFVAVGNTTAQTS